MKTVFSTKLGRPIERGSKVCFSERWVAIANSLSCIHLFDRSDGKNCVLFSVIKLPSDVRFLVPFHDGDYIIIGGRCGRIWFHLVNETLGSPTSDPQPSPSKRPKLSSDINSTFSHLSTNAHSSSPIRIVTKTPSDSCGVHSGLLCGLLSGNKWLLVAGNIAQTLYLPLAFLTSPTDSSNVPLLAVEGLDGKFASTMISLTSSSHRQDDLSVVLSPSLFEQLFGGGNAINNSRQAILHSSKDGSLHWWLSPSPDYEEESIQAHVFDLSGPNSSVHPVVSILGVSSGDPLVEAAFKVSDRVDRISKATGLLLVSACGSCRLITTNNCVQCQSYQDRDADSKSNKVCIIDFHVGFEVKSACSLSEKVLILSKDGKAYVIPVTKDRVGNEHIYAKNSMHTAQESLFSPTPQLGVWLPIPGSIVSMSYIGGSTQTGVAPISQPMQQPSIMFSLKCGRVLSVSCVELCSCDKWTLQSTIIPSSSPSSSTSSSSTEHVANPSNGNVSNMHVETFIPDNEEEAYVDELELEEVLEASVMPRCLPSLSRVLRDRLLKLTLCGEQALRSKLVREHMLASIEAMSESIDLLADIRESKHSIVSKVCSRSDGALFKDGDRRVSRLQTMRGFYHEIRVKNLMGNKVGFEVIISVNERTARLLANTEWCYDLNISNSQRQGESMGGYHGSTERNISTPIDCFKRVIQTPASSISSNMHNNSDSKLNYQWKYEFFLDSNEVIYQQPLLTCFLKVVPKASKELPSSSSSSDTGSSFDAVSSLSACVEVGWLKVNALSLVFSQPSLTVDPTLAGLKRAISTLKSSQPSSSLIGRTRTYELCDDTSMPYSSNTKKHNGRFSTPVLPSIDSLHVEVRMSPKNASLQPEQVLKRFLGSILGIPVSLTQVHKTQVSDVKCTLAVMFGTDELAVFVLDQEINQPSSSTTTTSSSPSSKISYNVSIHCTSKPHLITIHQELLRSSKSSSQYSHQDQQGKTVDASNDEDSTNAINKNNTTTVGHNRLSLSICADQISRLLYENKETSLKITGVPTGHDLFHVWTQLRDATKTVVWI